MESVEWFDLIIVREPMDRMVHDKSIDDEYEHEYEYEYDNVIM